MGVRARGNGLQRTEYRCQRCGIVNQWKPDRSTRPVWCFDCTVVVRDIPERLQFVV